MAYGDYNGENLMLLKRTIFGWADFSGRSRRTELVYYLIATALVGAVGHFIFRIVFSLVGSLKANLVLNLIIFIPVFALFARRLHDQNLSGYWAFLLPLFTCFSVAQKLQFIRMMSDPDAFVGHLGLGAWAWIAIPCALAIFILSYMRGTEGDNRFGTDPRQAR